MIQRLARLSALAFAAIAPVPVAAADATVVATDGERLVVLVNHPHVAAFIVGGAILFVALFSAWLRAHWITGPMVSLGVGMVLGPLGLAAFAPAQWSHNAEAVELLARATLAVSLMAAALHLPRSWLKGSWRPATLFLLLAMGLMWGATTLLVKWILPVGWLAALLLGAIATPTDPVLASAIVTGPLAERAIPGRLRHLLQAESAANDGLAFLFVMVPVLLLQHGSLAGLGYVALWQVVGASAVGVLAGWGVALLQRRSARYQLAEYDALLSVALALAIMVGGGLRAADGDGVLAVFAAGLAFRLTIHEDAVYKAEEQIQDAVQRLFVLPIFVLIGMLVPWDAWLKMGWRAPVLAAVVLLLRRLPAVLLVYRWIRPIERRVEALFCGWFGPIGISAVFYAVMAERLVDVEQVWPVVSLLVVSSTVIHGLSSTPLARGLAAAEPDGAE